MFDAHIRPLIDPPLSRVGRALAALGIGANIVTLVGLVLGLCAGVVLAQGEWLFGLGLIIANRLLDGLDGAVARATQITDFGGYLDIVADYVFYIAVPLGFGFAAASNLPWGLLLVASFTLTAVTFLAFAVMAAKRDLETSAHGKKSFFYNTGLAEGTETILAFVGMCLWPAYFPQIAGVLAALCVLTALQRSWAAWRLFR